MNGTNANMNTGDSETKPKYDTPWDVDPVLKLPDFYDY